MPGMDQSNVYDVAIIGGGTGGYVAAIRAAQHGKRVVIVEKHLLGGTCLHQGCIPTKSLLESSKLYNRVKQMDEFGIEVNQDSLFFNAAKAFERKKAIVNQLYQGIQYLIKKNKITLLHGHGHLVGKQKHFEIGVENESTGSVQTIFSNHVILATGSRPNIPRGITIDGIKLFTSDEILAHPLRPDHITIIGAGAIGLEFACYFQELGSAVRIVESEDRLAPLEDKEISEQIGSAFDKRGIETMPGYRILIEHMEQMEDGKMLYTLQSTKGETSVHQTDVILFAVGRKNNISALGLSNVGMEDEGAFLQTNAYMETAVPGLYAVGDIAGSYQLAHVATQQALIAADTICGISTLPYQPERVARCTYTHPEIASVGLTEEQAKAAGYKVKIGKFPLHFNGRSLIHGDGEGFIKMIVDEKTDMILGTHMIGQGATELIAMSGFAIFMEGTAWEMGMNVYPHPSLSEIFGEAAMAVSGMAIHS
ncbi:dihydrolipoyl dehydrogenase [Paenibacillus baekrokdamisoli]|uniref:Dihydrolipoyl dehydrogenase n=1 Tax=Paenibacillus baekrokdamisoli TaxID=1712516 RepID=A0A3G9J122_9BACL|nr:dihydrolipoyl dehydrogenase [Paenibacillus baekrokdamisoli]MBB3071776.1 dihydrolipoamide dehydrogenase [Paenibacillus baekrokdamisoli]BBH24242.1 dihydrolipoyl dehydrogenase [Paenibacillus baekrokdamisoli]